MAEFPLLLMITADTQDAAARFVELLEKAVYQLTLETMLIEDAHVQTFADLGLNERLTWLPKKKVLQEDYDIAVSIKK